MPFSLSPDKIDAFISDVSASIFCDVTPVESPHVIFLGGQPGCGKSTLRDHAARFFKGNFVHIDPDVIRPQHPNAYMASLNPETVYAALYEDVQKCVNHLISRSIELKFNLVIEGTLAWEDVIEDRFIPFRQAGYLIHVYVIATHLRYSCAGVFKRYENDMISGSFFPRLLEYTTQKEMYEAHLEVIDRIEKERRADEIVIFDRSPDNHRVLYPGKLPRTRKEKWAARLAPGSAVEAIKVERNRTPTRRELCGYNNDWSFILNSMISRREPESIVLSRASIGYNEAFAKSFFSVAVLDKLAALPRVYR